MTTWDRRVILVCAACLITAHRASPQPCQEVRFDFIHNQIILHPTVNGSGPFDMVLDTGTYASTLDQRLAERLGIPLDAGRTEAAGAGRGRVFGRHLKIAELRLGGLVAANLTATALDLSETSRQLGRPLHGVLGFSFLAKRIVQIDYFRRMVRFCADSPFGPSARPPDTPKRVSFPMQFRERSVLPVFEDCYINGKRIPITLDTGSSLGLILFPRAIRALGLEELARQGIPFGAVGYRGAVRLTKGWTRSLVLRTIDLGAVEVAYVEKGYGDNEVPESRGGNLGNAILQDFILTLDYQNYVVVLENVAE